MQRKILFTTLAILLVIVIWFVFAPPQFVLNLLKPVDLSNPAETGKALVTEYNCASCHPIGNEGRPFGPRLDGVTRRYSSDELRLWLLNPNKVKPGTVMPDFNLSDREIEAIMSYLQTLGNS